MDFALLFVFFLVLIIPGFIGALAFSITSRFSTEISVRVALVLDLLTFIIMITGLYFFRGVANLAELLVQLNCLSFLRNYALLSIFIAILLGVGFGFLRRLFFWLRR